MSGGNCPGGNCPGGNCPDTHIVSCLSTNREINKHQNSHCLKTRSLIRQPPSFGIKSIQIYFAAYLQERGTAEWTKALTVFVLVI